MLAQLSDLLPGTPQIWRFIGIASVLMPIAGYWTGKAIWKHRGPTTSTKFRIVTIFCSLQTLLLGLLTFSLCGFRQVQAAVACTHMAMIPAGFILGPFMAFVPPRRRVLDYDACKHCHYDLRGNASGVCPECGNPVDSIH